MSRKKSNEWTVLIMRLLIAAFIAIVAVCGGFGLGVLIFLLVLDQIKVKAS